jgi:serine protease Do
MVVMGTRTRVRARFVPSLIVALATTLFVGACTGSKPAPSLPSAAASGAAGSGTPTLPQPSQLPPVSTGTDPIVEVVKRVQPAVVNVTSSVVELGSLGQPTQAKGVGTGFVIRSDGIIVTNFHVVEGAVTLKVSFPPPHGQSYNARVIGGDSDHDLAILKVDVKDVPTLPLGQSSKLQLGQRVIALGYALALEGGPTVTSGIISSLARTIRVQDPNGPQRTYQDALQTDAAINPGNSGGPLVDLAGNVIGINTAGAVSAENIGFSIAIDAAKPIIQSAIANPNAPAAYLGVSTTTVNPVVAAQLGLPVDRGALVLASTGPSQKAGIKQGDIIASLNGSPVTNTNDLSKLILQRRPGDVVRVGLVNQQGGGERSKSRSECDHCRRDPPPWECRRRGAQ